ncbi:hypothetical protein [Arthrobacter sp. B1805]|uniref:hypothetical protein n=1 Tax=Arthrobacter sp. B1805 TaxID=2058892 RepID=UPI0015E29F8B|nr:hypothetical protein [Arthrobacter sp. B1805]
MRIIRNISPLGALDVPLLGKTLEPGEEISVKNKTADQLLLQSDNYELVEAGNEGDDSE